MPNTFHHQASGRNQQYQFNNQMPNGGRYMPDENGGGGFMNSNNYMGNQRNDQSFEVPHVQNGGYMNQRAHQNQCNLNVHKFSKNYFLEKLWSVGV